MIPLQQEPCRTESLVGRPATGQTQIQRIRVPNEDWSDLHRLAGRDSHHVVRELIRWYLRRPGARLPSRPGADELVREVAYAIRDERGEWHGKPDLFDDFNDGTLTVAAGVSARRFAGQTVTVRYAPLEGDPHQFEGPISTISTTIVTPDGQRLPVLFTRDLEQTVAQKNQDSGQG